MADPHDIESSRLVRDPAEQRRHWRLERVVWCALGVTVVAALLGLLGPGPLSRVTVGDPEIGVRISHQRLLHMESPHDVRIEARAAPGAHEVSFAISTSYLERMHLESMTPAPVRVSSGDGETVFHLDAGGIGATVVALLRFDAASPGSVRGFIRREGEVVQVSHFVFP
jgi:hypothetical protein